MSDVAYCVCYVLHFACRIVYCTVASQVPRRVECCISHVLGAQLHIVFFVSVGIGAGFITHVVIRLVQGRGKEIHPLLYLVSGLFIVYFMSSPLNAWFG